MDSEVLIRLVRAHEELYDSDHPKYLDASHKEDIWQQIGWEFNQSASMCKSRWSNLRDNYRKYLKKTVTGSGKAKVCRYRYSRQLQFLDKYMRKRSNNTTLLSAIGFDEPSQVKEESTPDWSETEGITIESNDLLENEDSDREELKSNEDIVKNNTTKNEARRKRQFSFVSPPSKRRLPQKQAGTSSDLIKYLLVKDEEKRSAGKTLHQQPDAVDAFLAGLAPTLKKLPPYYLNNAKTKIFGIVQEYELRTIMESEKEPDMSLNSLPSLSPPSQYSPTPMASSPTSELGEVDP